MDESHKQTKTFEQPFWIEQLDAATGLRAALCRRLLEWIDHSIDEVRVTHDMAKITFRYHEVQTDDADGTECDYLEVIIEDQRHETIEGAL